jgi:hypothetical protein
MKLPKSQLLGIYPRSVELVLLPDSRCSSLLVPRKIGSSAANRLVEQTRNSLRQDSEWQDRAGFNGLSDLIRAMNRLMQ